MPPRESIEDIKIEFKFRTRKEYKQSSHIDQYCIIEEVNETDGNFLKIGDRPQIEREIFDPRSNWAREIIGLGHTVAFGEEKYFVKNIINNIEAEEINESSLRQEDIVNQLGNLGERPLENSIILGSVDSVYKKMMQKNHWIQWDNELDCFCLQVGINKIPVHSVSEDFIGNNLILLNKNSVKWRYKIDNDGERLHIEIYDSKVEPWKYDIILYVLFKQILENNFIRVISLI